MEIGYCLGTFGRLKFEELKHKNDIRHKVAKSAESARFNKINVRDDINAYLNSPDRCPKYIEKEPTVSTSQPAFSPRRLSIPTAFLKQG